MSTGYRRGTVVVACLLLTGCLSAGLASDDSAAPIRVLSSRGLASPVNHGSPVTPSPMVLDTVYDNDVGVTAITAPAGLFCFCDTIRPLTCMVSNFGTANQTGVPVTCRMWDSVGPTLVYNQTVNVDVASGETVAVSFPLGPGDVAPRGRNTRVYDTCFTSLATDELRANDTARSSISVNAMADVTLSYNDGTTGPNGCYSWTSPNYTTAVRFPGPCPVSKIAVGLMGFTSGPHGPYPCTCKVRLNDGANGMPGTEVWVSQETLYGAGYPNDYINYIVIDPPAVVTSDSFYVTWKPQEVADPFPSFDWDQPIQIGNDFSTMPGSEVFGPLAIGPQTDAAGDLIMNAYYSGFLHDVAVGSIDVPPEVVDSGTTFTPAVTFKNAGLKSRPGSVVAFWITDTGGHKVSMGSGNAPGLNPGETYTATFPPAVTPKPTDYMDSATIHCSAHDANTANDTLEQALFVRYYDVMCQPVRPWIYEEPGIVPVVVRLTNKGNVPAQVDSVNVVIDDYFGYYSSFTTGIPLAPGETKLVYMPVPWVCPVVPGLRVTTWITCPSDMYHRNDTAWFSCWPGIPGWAEKTPLPATPSGKGIKDGGCMAFDASQELIFASKGNRTGDFYAYDAVAGTWASKAAIPLGAEGRLPYRGSVICSDGNGKLYLTKGNNTVGFWGYNAANDAWTQLTNVPLGSSNKKVKQGAGLAWATKAGVGSFTYLLKGCRNEFHRYDPGTNTWKQLLDAPVGPNNRFKWDAGSWLVADADAGNRLYAFKGKYHEFYAYDTDVDTWTRPLTPMPIPGSAGNKKARDGSCAAWYCGKIYAFKGGNTTEFWRYFPLGDSWKKLDDIPMIGMTGARRKVRAGGALASFPGMGLFAFKGNKSLEFWNYVPSEIAGAQPTRDGVTAGSTKIGALSFAIAPNPLAGGLATVRYNLPKAGLATLNVFDVAGRTVLTQTMAAGRTGTASLDLRKLEAGVYLVKVTTEGFSTTQKLVVQH
jgi:hypothetical protein